MQRNPRPVIHLVPGKTLHVCGISRRRIGRGTDCRSWRGVLHHMEAMEPGGPRLGGPQREVTGVRRITRLMVVAFSVMVLLGGLLVGWGAVTTPAGASTTIGQTGADASIGCLGGPTSLVQTSTGSGVPGYAVPSGVNEIASWSAQGSFTNSLLALEVWRPTATPGSYELVGVSPPETIENTLNTFTLASPIPVQPGDVLGQFEQCALRLLLRHWIWSGGRRCRVCTSGVDVTADTRHHCCIHESAIRRGAQYGRNRNLRVQVPDRDYLSA